jgi:hypothetical protein
LRKAGILGIKDFSTPIMKPLAWSWNLPFCLLALAGAGTICRSDAAVWRFESGAVEKGTSSPAELAALLDDVKLEQIPALSALTNYRLNPLPAPLEKARGVHPRLYLNAERVAQLR